MANGIIICSVVEGLLDEAVMQRLIAQVNAIPGPAYGKQGKQHIRQKIGGYSNAAQSAPWVVLVDLDDDYECAPLLRNSWLLRPAPHLCFRVAVREVEAWLLADADRIAAFLSVKPGRIPVEPELLNDPKTVLVNLARSSRRKEIRADIVPREGSGRQIGPAYTSRLIEFVSSSWRPDIAARRSVSLDSAIKRLRQFVVTA
jgi:hypothetical protein